MICKPCQEGGEFMRKLGPDPSGRYTSLSAQMLHNYCKGGTWCDCQHDVSGTAINPVFNGKKD